MACATTGDPKNDRSRSRAGRLRYDADTNQIGFDGKATSGFMIQKDSATGSCANEDGPAWSTR
jgi:hypothetical protein